MNSVLGVLILLEVDVVDGVWYVIFVKGVMYWLLVIDV